MNDQIRANEKAWDLKTPHHVQSNFYDIGVFLDGTSTLRSLERELCGDVAGLKLLHLQCHFGLDTLSWVRLGANATGVDFSSEAVAAARDLADRARLDATFIKADVQRLPEDLNGRFDLVVSTYGALCWLKDLSAWASGLAAALRPGGRAVIIEFHPFLDVFFDGCVSGKRSYFGGLAREISSRGTYAARTASIELTEYLWQHPISEVIGALLSTGLRLDQFMEYPYCSYPIVPAFDIERDGWWSSSCSPDLMPCLYSLVVSKS